MNMAIRTSAWAILVVALLLGLLSAGGEQPLRAEEQPPPSGAANAEVRPPAGAATPLDAAAAPTLDAPSPTCYRAQEYTDICYIEWAYIQASTVTPNYMVSTTVALDNRPRASVSGFFQSSIYLPAQMFGRGFQVACGTPGAGGNPSLGGTHTYAIHVRDTIGGVNTATGSIACPADVIPVHSVTLDGPVVGATGAAQPFTATVAPVTATLPITYSFAATDLLTTTLANGPTVATSLTWSTAGTKTVTVDAQNIAGVASDQHDIRLDDRTFLPRVSRGGGK